MYSDPLRSRAADLGWSMWTELGVSGTIRNHSSTEIDLEPLLAATPTLAADDPRLVEQVICWCAAHGEHVNVGRLSTLVRALPLSARRRFEEFAATVNAAAGSKWPAAGEPSLPLPRLRDVSLPLERRALVRLRARALCGVGTRADVLCDLLATPREWTTAARLAEGGHSKRNVARVLSDFEAARLVVRQVSGNASGFRLARPEALDAVLGDRPSAHPRWAPVLNLALQLVDLAGLEVLPAPVRRVEASTRREALAPLAERLWVDSPPPTRGDPEAWEALLTWATATLEDLANGTSPALG